MRSCEMMICLLLGRAASALSGLVLIRGRPENYLPRVVAMRNLATPDAIPDARDCW